MQRALDRLVGKTKDAANDVDNAFDKTPPKIDNVAKSLNKTRFETANLAAQFQDIAVQLQGGASPFTVALQQGTQITQVLGQQGATGVVQLLGSAFLSLLTPVSLATIGIIALGGYAVQYGARAIGAVDDLDDKLKKHADLIKSLKNAYGEAGSGIDVAVKDSIAVLKTLLSLSTDDLQKQFRNLANSAVVSMTDFAALGDAVGQSIERASSKFAAFKGPIDDLRAGMAAGAPDIRAFRLAISEIERSTADEKIKKQAGELLAYTDAAYKAEQGIRSAAKATRMLSAEMQSAADQGEEFAKAMKALSGTVTPDLSDRERIMKNYDVAMLKATDTADRMFAAEERNKQLSILSANERKKASEDAAKEAQSAQDRFDRALESVARRSAKMQGQGLGLASGIGEITRLETEYRLTEQAQQSFGKVTDETRAKIKAQAEAAGQAADVLSRAHVAANTDFNFKTAFLSPQDLQIAQQLRGIYGNDIPAALQSTEAAGIRAADTLRAIGQVGQDVTRGVFTDFASQIRSGATAMDALRVAGVNALGKISEKLMSMAADNLWTSAFGGSSGMGGLLTSLFKGGGGSFMVGGQSFPMFANGTNSAPGGLAIVGERGPELVNLPRGAQVIPNNLLPSIPAAMMNDNMSVSVGGSVINIHGNADQATLALMRQELARRDAELPHRVVNAVQDARKRRVLS
ncbi:hypothetical protein AFEL58S_02043 [Afipia felis]